MVDGPSRLQVPAAVETPAWRRRRKSRWHQRPVGSRTGAPTVGSGGSSNHFRVGPQSGSPGHVSSPRLLKRSMRISRFPELRCPVCFASRVMWPIRSGALSPWPAATGLDGNLRTVPAAHTATSCSTNSYQIHGGGVPASPSLSSGERSSNTGSNGRIAKLVHPSLRDRIDDRLLVQGMTASDVVARLSRRQAHHYVQDARALGQPAAPTEALIPTTIKIPDTIAQTMRAHARSSGLAIGRSLRGL